MRSPLSFHDARWRLTLLAPVASAVPSAFAHHVTDRRLHSQVLSELQRLRARTYLADGAITKRQLADDGRHKVDGDEGSWHLVYLDPDGHVAGCARYRSHSNRVRFADLGVRRAALARSWEWGRSLKQAVTDEITLACRRSIAYVEVGGWALADALRSTGAALTIALATYGLGRLLGGCISIGTATHRHASASILERIGGERLSRNGVRLPDYYDPAYRCRMSVLRFDSDVPNPRYEGWVEAIRSELLSVPVVSRAYDRARDEAGCPARWAPAWLTAGSPRPASLVTS